MWLYSGQLLEDREPAADLPLRVAVDSYFFGQFACIPQLRNAIVDVIVDRTESFSIRNIGRIYNNTPGKSPLRRLTVDIFLNSSHPESPSWFRKDKTPYYRRAFLADVLVGQQKIMDGRRQKTKHIRATRSKYYIAVPDPKRCNVQK